MLELYQEYILIPCSGHEEKIGGIVGKTQYTAPFVHGSGATVRATFYMI